MSITGAIVRWARAQLALSWASILDTDAGALHQELMTTLWYVDPSRGTCRRLASCDDRGLSAHTGDAWDYFDGAGHVEVVWKTRRSLVLWEGLQASTRACGAIDDACPVVLVPLSDVWTPTVLYVRLSERLRDILSRCADDVASAAMDLAAYMGPAVTEYFSRPAEPIMATHLRDLIGERPGSPAVVGVAHFDGAREPRVEINQHWLSSREVTALQHGIFEGSRGHAVARRVSADFVDSWWAGSCRVGVVSLPPTVESGTSLSGQCLVVEFARSCGTLRLVLPFGPTPVDLEAIAAMPLEGLSALTPALDRIGSIARPTTRAAALRASMRAVLDAAARRAGSYGRTAAGSAACPWLSAAELAGVADEIAALGDRLGASCVQAWATPLACRLRRADAGALCELTGDGTRSLPDDPESQDVFVAGHSAQRHAAPLGLLVSRLEPGKAYPLRTQGGYVFVESAGLLHVFGAAVGPAAAHTVCIHAIEGGRLLLITPLTGIDALDLARRLATEADVQAPGRHLFSWWSCGADPLTLVGHVVLDVDAFAAREAERLTPNRPPTSLARPFRVTLRHVRRDGRLLGRFAHAAAAALRDDSADPALGSALRDAYAEEVPDARADAPALGPAHLRPTLACTLTALGLGSRLEADARVSGLAGLARSMYVTPVAPGGMLVAYGAGAPSAGRAAFRRGSGERRQADELARALATRPRPPVLSLLDGEPCWFGRRLHFTPGQAAVLARLIEAAADLGGVDLGDRDPKVTISKLRLAIAEQATEAELREVAALLGVPLPTRALLPVDRRTCVTSLFVKAPERKRAIGDHRYRIALPADRIGARRG